MLKFLLNTGCSDYYSCQLELYDRVLNTSRSSLRPVDNDTKTIDVHFGFSMIRLVSVVSAIRFL